MSRENVEVVRRGWEAYGRGDLAGAVASFADDAITVGDPSLPDQGAYRGGEGALQSLREFAESFEDFRQTPLEFIDAGDCVITRARQEGVGAHSGVPVGTDLWFVFTLRDGQIVRLELYLAEEDAREAAGLSK